MKKILVVTVCFLLAGVFFSNLNVVSAQEQEVEEALDTPLFEMTPENLIGKWETNFVGSKFASPIGKKPAKYSETLYLDVEQAESGIDPMTDAPAIFGDGDAYVDQAMQVDPLGFVVLKSFIAPGNTHVRADIFILTDETITTLRGNLFFVPGIAGKKPKPDGIVGSVERLYHEIYWFTPNSGIGIVKESSVGKATFTKISDTQKGVGLRKDLGGAGLGYYYECNDGFCRVWR